jgi:hypothetical protein
MVNADENTCDTRERKNIFLSSLGRPRCTTLITKIGWNRSNARTKILI